MALLRLPRRAGWNHVFEAAASPSNTIRAAALTRSYAWVEHALDAANVPGWKRPTVTRILSTFTQEALKRGLNADEVKRAIVMRHRTGHEDEIPPPDACISAVKTMRNVWHWLSLGFVTEPSAITLGRHLASRPGVLAVCLYGSMARLLGAAPAPNSPTTPVGSEPNDLDLLVLDDGQYSTSIELSVYSEGAFDAVKQTKRALELLGFPSPKLRRCAQCRWLDVLIVDGARLGSDRKYTSGLRLAQPDPWFFLNIARDLKELDAEHGRYQDCVRFPFNELKKVHTDLAKVGFA